MLASLTENAEKEGIELSTEDMFELYRNIREIWDLYRQIVQRYIHRKFTNKRDLKFDIQHFFAPAVNEWLEVTDSNAISWVERAVKTDTFQPENDEMKQSSSAMDLFQFIG